MRVAIIFQTPLADLQRERLLLLLQLQQQTLDANKNRLSSSSSFPYFHRVPRAAKHARSRGRSHIRKEYCGGRFPLGSGSLTVYSLPLTLGKAFQEE